MRFRIEVARPLTLSLFHETWLSKIVEDVHITLNTPIGSVPSNREFGIDMSYMHLPANVAMSAYASAAAEAIERFVPSLRVNQVLFENEGVKTEDLRPIIEVSSYEQT